MPRSGRADLIIDFLKMVLYFVAMPTRASKSPATIRTRRAIVHRLKQEGPLDAQTLASHLRVSAMAVRQHLYALQAEQLVTYVEVPGRLGRPAKRWQLTPAADRLFPEGYAELTLGLLTAMTEVFGNGGLEQLLSQRAQQQMEAYQQQMAGLDSLPERLDALAAIRTDEGYMAEVQAQADGSFLLLEKHCPICAAAMACTGLCGKELEVFQAVLGEDVRIERTEHIVTGARRCVYRVLSAAPSNTL